MRGRNFWGKTEREEGGDLGRLGTCSIRWRWRVRRKSYCGNCEDILVHRKRGREKRGGEREKERLASLLLSGSIACCGVSFTQTGEEEEEGERGGGEGRNLLFLLLSLLLPTRGQK